MVKNLLPIAEDIEMWVRSLGLEDLLEKEITHSIFLPGESRGLGSLAGYCPLRRRHDCET